MQELVNNSRCVFYFSEINAIGGVESFFWYLANLYKNIEVYYKKTDPKQIERLARLIPTHKYTGGKIVCDKFFCQYNVDILDQVEANDIFYIVHSDYKNNGYLPITHPKINHYIGVSQTVCDSFKELTGLDCELIYNPVVIDKKAKKPLVLVSAMRMSPEKGKDNLIKIADKLDKENLPYIWLVFTNSTREIQNPNIIYLSPRLDIAPYLKLADIVVAPSKSEAFGYTPVEALMLGIPVVLMDLPIWHELGIKDGVHGWIIKDIDNFDVHKLYDKLPKFEYKPPKSNWDKYLNNNSDYNPNFKVKVKPIRSYFDVELGKWLNPGDEPFEIENGRAIYLYELGLVKEVL